LHGWALHGGVWDNLAPELTSDWRVTRTDLPGHGRSRDVPMPTTLTELARLVAHTAPGNAIWLGWSLGGMLALRAALDNPTRVRALVLVSSTACFVTADNWSCAMPPNLLQEFATELQRDYRNTVQRFLGLQVRGDEHARDTLRQFRGMLRARGEPDTASLAAGLEILRSSDLRAELGHIAVPTLVISGEYDRLTPPGAGEALAAAIGGARMLRFAKAAHAPFLSHPREFIAALRDFLRPLRRTSTEGCGSRGVPNHG
jgi:pimeloyl-[acyl-carrier protein] methyl ester esterase